MGNKEDVAISKQLTLADEYLFKEIEFKLLQEEIDKILATLPVMEQEIINMRFGLNGSTTLTVEEIGKHFKETPQQILNILAKALRRLRHPRRSLKLKDYLDH